MPGEGHRGFLARAHIGLVYLGGLYAIVIVLLTVPTFQRHLLYSHAIRLPLRTNYDLPERYGLAPGKTLNLNLTTSDNIRLGAWFVAADGFYRKHLSPSPPAKSSGDNPTPSETYHPRDKLQSMFPLALQNHPTILFFHGNAMTRAFYLRTRLYSVLSSRLDANVFAIDYRGFGNSEGSPTESGLFIDARTAWDWLVRHGAKPQDITVMGQSLGTGVSAGLVAQLAREGASPRGVVLLSPYSSIPKLLETYDFGGKIPVLRPLQSFRFVFDIVIKQLRDHFDTLSRINHISCPITIIHAEDDWDIPISHARALFDALINPLLPTYPFDPGEISRGKVSQSDAIKFVKARNTRRNELIATKWVEGLGTISVFERGGQNGSVLMLETTWGEHNGIAGIEGVVDVIRWSVGKGKESAG